MRLLREQARVLAHVLGAGAIGVGVIAACGSENSAFGPDGGTGEGGASSGVGSIGSSSSGDPTDADTTSNDADLNPDSACAQANAQATLKPLDMFIMFDSSISMGTPGGGGDCNVGQSVNSPWCSAINALASYFADPASANNAAALQFFGQGGGAPPAGVCTSAAGFDVSVVPGGATGYQAIATGASAFTTALNNAAPDQHTPLEAALRGITKFTANAANQRAGRSTIGVLITDADTPLDCSTNWTDMAGILSAHLTATGIKTFVIGMNGANFTNLEQLATAGGGPSHADTVGAVTDTCGGSATTCRHWNAGNGTSSAPLVEALKQIQGLAVGCSFTIPSPDAGTIDPNQVKVEYVPGSGATQQLSKVTDAAACSGAGWYYDDNANPKTVNLCPSSCTTVQADSAAKLNVLFGCVIGGSSSGSSGNPK